MNQRLSVAGLGSLAVFLISACGAARSSAENAGSNLQTAATTPGTNVTDRHLPINQRFGGLDEYLAYLEKMQGPVDGPWYKQVSPGVYELQTGNFRPLDGDSGRKRRFTREELMQKFGFTR